MRKIPTIFMRDFHGDPSRLLEVENPDCKWVFDGEGIATRKLDGTCCKFDGAQWWKRREVKSGKQPPELFVLEEHDSNTGKSFGWVPISDADKWHAEGVNNTPKAIPGTYELCGPKVQGNPEGFQDHRMVRHGSVVVDGVPRTFKGLQSFLRTYGREGIVFHHPDGRMAKIKARDF